MHPVLPVSTIPAPPQSLLSPAPPQTPLLLLSPGWRMVTHWILMERSTRLTRQWQIEGPLLTWTHLLWMVTLKISLETTHAELPIGLGVQVVFSLSVKVSSLEQQGKVARIKGGWRNLSVAEQNNREREDAVQGIQGWKTAIYRHNEILLKMCRLHCVCSSLPPLYALYCVLFLPIVLLCYTCQFSNFLYPSFIPATFSCCIYSHAVVLPVLHWWGPLYSGWNVWSQLENNFQFGWRESKINWHTTCLSPFILGKLDSLPGDHAVIR